MLRKKRRGNKEGIAYSSSPRGNSSAVEFFSYRNDREISAPIMVKIRGAAPSVLSPLNAIPSSVSYNRRKLKTSRSRMKFNHVLPGNVKPVWSRVVHIGLVPTPRDCHCHWLDDRLVSFVVSFVKIGIPRIEREKKAKRRIPTSKNSCYGYCCLILFLIFVKFSISILYTFISYDNVIYNVNLYF